MLEKYFRRGCSESNFFPQKIWFSLEAYCFVLFCFFFSFVPLIPGVYLGFLYIVAVALNTTANINITID